MSEILTQQTAGVLVVTFNRPARINTEAQAFATLLQQEAAQTAIAAFAKRPR